MPRVIGIDPGTVSIDLCGLDAGRVFLDRSLPTAEALARPSELIDLLDAAHRDAPVDLVAGPSGYGLPLTNARDLTDTDIRLAQLTAEGEQSGGIGGLGTLMRLLARATMPVVFTPGVVHLASVPAHRKANRVDMGTADKVCAAALAIHDQAKRRGCSERDVSFILLELGGAFTAAIAVERGRIVDGIGGTSGPIGMRGGGALDGEVAFLAGSIPKGLLFGGGASTIAGVPDVTAAELAAATAPQGRQAWAAYVESAVKAVATLAVSVPHPLEVILSGRLARVPGLQEELAGRIARVLPGAPVHVLIGFATTAKQAAQGAALLADGLAGGRSAPLVEAMGIREARGTVLDHLYVITPAAARSRLGIVDEPAPVSEPIQLVDYNPHWQEMFEREAGRIEAALGSRAVRIEHTGSTAVPGLAAKPIIDLLLVVSDSADEDAYVPALEAAGYVLRIREPAWYEHRMFKGPDTDVNLHVFSSACPEIDRMLTFRDWLRNNAADRDLYEYTKRALALKKWKHVQNYADAKTVVIEEIMSRARDSRR